MDTIPSHDEPTDGPSGRRPERAARARTILALTAVAGLALAFGRPTRHGAFLMGDDQRFVTEHVLVNHPSLAHAWELLTIVHGDLWQPLPLLSFQANYATAARDPHRRFGIDPLVFHLTNIGLHMVNAVLACLVALRLSRRLPVALLTGLMFACHPLALEPVAWVSGRMILLATAFSLATLWVCLGRRRDARGRWPLWAGLLWACSLLSKVLPTVPLAAAWSDRRLHGRLPRRAWLVYGAFFVLGLVLSLQAFRATARAGFTDGGGRETHASAPVRWILAVRYGLENYVWPSRLSPWSPPPQGIGLTSRSVWVGLLECGAFLLVLPVAGKRSPTVLLGLVLFAILLAPFLAASTARRLLVADRYFYLPLLGLHLATAAAAVQMADRIKRRFSRKVAVAGVSSVGAIVLALWTWTGWRLAPTWSDSIHLYERAAAIYPESVLARAEWAKACNFQGRPDLALAIVEEARRRWPDHPRLAAQAGHAYRLENDDIRAEAELRAAVAAMPQHLSTAYAYALVLDALGRRDAARRQYVRILGLNPDFLPAITALARADLAAGETDRAIAGFERALRVNPHHRESLFQLARLRMGRGELRRAAALLRRILDLDPDDGPARFNLAVVLFRSGAHEAALDLCDRLRREDPTNQSILVNRANVLAALGREAEAEAAYRGILRLHPDSFEAVVSLHELLRRQKRFDDLITLWRGFSGRMGDENEARACLAWAHALKGDMPAADRLAGGIAQSSSARALADWAWVYDALRREAWDDLEARLKRLPLPAPGEAPADARLLARRREQTRIIAPALADLPESIRQSTAGRYALARLFRFSGEPDLARETCRQLLASPNRDRWTAAAEELLRLIDRERSLRAAPGP